MRGSARGCRHQSKTIHNACAVQGGNGNNERSGDIFKTRKERGGIERAEEWIYILAESASFSVAICFPPVEYRLPFSLRDVL